MPDAKQVINDLTVRQIGMIDQNMHHLLTDQVHLQEEMAQQKADGKLPGSAPVTRLQAALNDQQKKIDSYAAEWRDLQIKMSGKGLPISFHAPDLRASTPAPNSTPIDTGKVGGVQLDLISLANTMVDASGAAHLAKAEYDRIIPLGKTNAVGQQLLDTTKVNLETAEKRLRLLRGIAEIALEGAQIDFDRAQKMQAQGMETAQSATDAKAKLQILKMILSNAN
jgi:multidrug resistance efflux pump